VHFPGYYADPTPLYQAADAALLASQSESLPNFLLEAQLHGLPALAYDVVGVGECFVPGRSGFLLKNRDQDAFVDALDRFIRSPGLRRHFSEAARRHAQAHFTAERQVQAHLALFAEIAGK